MIIQINSEFIMVILFQLFVWTAVYFRDSPVTQVIDLKHENQ
ncbi:MAG: hypothetical protein Edafosvirus5_55 [Edafosvirus sp.]|uniref:Uncharacterized protein n=1 Tax=Edafosvirus sp. TaxID=2487765 RepID=A0A3G4ZTC9_9VIRU|nr:MAG: hypothetical protein Edafosvirus5_55 [Edafosvirus sp.]